MEITKLFECPNCQSVQYSSTIDDSAIKCQYCDSFCKEYYILKCTPVENNDKHFRLDKDLVLLLNRFAGRECIVRIEPC